MSERIAFDARYVNDRYHGIGRYAFRLLEAMVAHAPQRTFIVLRGQANDSRFDWRRLQEAPNVRLEAGPWPLYWPQEQVRWPLLLRRLEVDLFHSPYFVAPLLSPVPSIITIHDLIFDRYPSYMPQRYARPYYRLLMWLGTRRARRIVCVSRFTARDLGQYYDVSPQKIAVTGAAPDPALQPVQDEERLQRIRDQYDLHSPFILTVGARRPHKNLGRLVEAFARLAPAVPHDLVLAGPADERFPDEARHTATRLALDGRVRFLGWVSDEDLTGLYTMAAVVAVPSLVEGFGLPALEAMSCGAPVLANGATSLPEVVGDAGVLLDATDVQALARGLRRLVSDDDLRHRLAAAGKRRAASFTWAATAQRTMALYDDLT